MSVFVHGMHPGSLKAGGPVPLGSMPIPEHFQQTQALLKVLVEQGETPVAFLADHTTRKNKEEALGLSGVGLFHELNITDQPLPVRCAREKDGR
jgi:hypothetical protein